MSSKKYLSKKQANEGIKETVMIIINLLTKEQLKNLEISVNNNKSTLFSQLMATYWEHYPKYSLERSREFAIMKINEISAKLKDSEVNNFQIVKDFEFLFIETKSTRFKKWINSKKGLIGFIATTLTAPTLLAVLLSKFL